MATEMVERVAEALDPQAFNAGATWLGYSVRRAKARDKARAAIRAMKDPTEEMVKLGGYQRDARTTWRVMCRTALGEDEGHG